jgi:hypothetical protein
MIHDLHREIIRHIDELGGRSPKRVRVHKSILDIMEAEAREMALYQREDKGGDFKIAGIPIVADLNIKIGEYDE